MATRSSTQFSALAPLTRARRSFKSIAGTKVAAAKLPALQKKQKGQKQTFRARQARIESAAQARAAKELQRTRSLPIARTVKHIRSQMDIPSAIIWHAAFDESQQLLTVDFNTGRRYIYQNVDPADAWGFLGGKATCTTEGENQWGKWYKTKNPSMGAAFWQYIRRKGYPHTYMNTPIHQLPLRAIPATPFTTAVNWRY